MSLAVKASRTQVWLEGLGDWSWPGRSSAEHLPPSWVPTFPQRLEPALAAAAPAPATHGRYGVRRLGLGVFLSALAAFASTAALGGPTRVERLLGLERPVDVPAASVAAASASAGTQLPPVTIKAVSQDAAGSSIDAASFTSSALHGATGSFLLYLPPGYASTTRRYPVIYLLHGQDGHATAFVEIGIQGSLDRLIAHGVIPPMIAVMVQDLPSMNNWRDLGTRHSASYVIEVQQLVDRLLPTIADRSARAIAGNSMGGFGAMHVALANPTHFAVVESWLGYFNNLEGELRTDEPIIRRQGLQAFVYGAEEDPVADPNEDPVFATRLRAAGAHAESAVYPGGHSLEKIKEHLDAMLTFAGRSLAKAQAESAPAVGRTPRSPTTAQVARRPAKPQAGGAA